MISVSQPYFEDVKRALRIADHMIYITYPVLKENRLLVKVLEEVYSAVRKTIDIILRHEYEFKRIKIYSDSNVNMTIFEQRCAPRYGFTAEEMTEIKQIIGTFESHKSSPLEFVRDNKFVIMSDDLKTESLTLQRLKNMLRAAKEAVRKAEAGLSADKF